jgi:hypothetical protein
MPAGYETPRSWVYVMALELSPVLVAIREGPGPARGSGGDESAAKAVMAELYPLLVAAQDALGELAEALERRASSEG